MHGVGRFLNRCLLISIIDSHTSNTSRVGQHRVEVGDKVGLNVDQSFVECDSRLHNLGELLRVVVQQDALCLKEGLGVNGAVDIVDRLTSLRTEQSNSRVSLLDLVLTHKRERLNSIVSPVNIEVAAERVREEVELLHLRNVEEHCLPSVIEDALNQVSAQFRREVIPPISVNSELLIVNTKDFTDALLKRRALIASSREHCILGLFIWKSGLCHSSFPPLLLLPPEHTCLILHLHVFLRQICPTVLCSYSSC